MPSENSSASSLIDAQFTDTGVLRLTLNHQAKRNALSEAMMTELTDHLNMASTDKSVRVIIIAASGSVFCSGHDLQELTTGRQADDNGRDYFTHIMALCSTLMQTIVNHHKPIIAEVNGVATAAGAQLVASCDLAYATDCSRFGTPGVNIGLFCSTPMVALSRNVADKHAMEMLLTGDMLRADKAAEIGLINAAVPAQELTNTSMQVAEKIASKSALTLKIGKTAYYQQKYLKLDDAYQYAAQVMVDNMLIEDAKGGINAFLTKQQPTWKDQ